MKKRCDVTTKKKTRRVYKDEAGNKLPSVTEILGGLGWKYGALMAWANKLGREGKTLQEGSRDAMKIGLIAHDLIEAFVLGQTIPERGDIPRDLYDFVLGQIPERGDIPRDLYEPAFHCYEKFISWWREQGMQYRFELLGSEVAMVDRELGVGGTADLVGTLDGVATMLDYKTGKSIYAETAIQLEAYCHLWEVNGHCQSHDSEGEEIPDTLRIAREYNRRIERCAIIHIPVEGPVRIVEIPQDVRAASREIWMHLAAMQRHKQTFEAFGKSLREETTGRRAASVGAMTSNAASTQSRLRCVSMSNHEGFWHLVDVLSEIDKWQYETFPNATRRGALVHLEKEIKEAAEELADVVFLARQASEGETEAAAIRCIRELSMSPAKVLAAKLEKNKARRWPKAPDADGVYEHLEEETP